MTHDPAKYVLNSNVEAGAAAYGIVPIKSENLESSAFGRPKRLIERIRFQIGLGLIVCILVPMALRSQFQDASIDDPQIVNSGLISALALLIGYYASRSMHPFRGSAISTFSVPIITAAFAFAAIIPTFARIDYSRLQIAIHFIASVIFFIFTERLINRDRRLRFAVIPGGDVNKFPPLEQLELFTMREPKDFAQNVDGIIADLDSRHGRGWDASVTRHILAGIPVYHWRQLAERMTGAVDVKSISGNELGTLNPNRLYLTFKQVIDLVGALVLLLALWPVMLGIAVAIRLDSPGPAIFRQQRTGYQAQTFTVFKFRTMRLGTGSQTTHADQRDRAITHDADPRITRLGRFLRMCRLDELPQLFNVLRMEMSLIGPRPEAVPLTLWYEKEIPFYHYRHAIKPGITGWAQVNQGHVAGIDDTRLKLSYDFYYVKNCSLWIDILILLNTVVNVTRLQKAR